MPRPFAETDDRPQRTAERAAATQAATEQPLHVHGQSFTQHAVYAQYGGLELLGCHLG